ncbi:MAG TPA: holo-ACP synthase [Atopostipes sp.]|nr:holo-ACP synthase [Atopostipes sp.]
MIQGIGIDLVELERIEAALSRRENFYTRILTEKEQMHFRQLSKHRQVEFLAGRFAAKEAFSKALGTGIGSQLSFQDIEILPSEVNKPIAVSKVFSGTIHLSISHSKTYAIAQVILED